MLRYGGRKTASFLLNVPKQAITTARRLRGFDAPTVWQEFTPLAVKTKAVNLGQGFPDWASPEFVKEALRSATAADHNQYARSAGDPVLVEALASHYSPLVGRQIDGLTEVTVSVGATEALYALMQAVINEGDEVVVLEPAFDTYPAQVQMAGGVCNYVPLTCDVKNVGVKGKSAWTLDMNQLEAAITPKTKLMLLNTPHNPTGKVLSQDELLQISQILQRHPHVTAVCDEVYEKLVYDKRQHVRLASLPGMWDRTVTISSCGKTFSCTGWKVGWAYGPAHLIKPIMLANQWIQYCVSTPTQRAVASVIIESDKPYQGFKTYYDYVCAEYEKKRDDLASSLKDGKLIPVLPEGGFFIIADTSAYTPDVKYLNQPGPNGESPVSRDWAFARWLTCEAGVTPIPPSAFYCKASAHQASRLGTFSPFLFHLPSRLSPLHRNKFLTTLRMQTSLSSNNTQLALHSARRKSLLRRQRNGYRSWVPRSRGVLVASICAFSSTTSRQYLQTRADVMLSR